MLWAGPRIGFLRHSPLDAHSSVQVWHTHTRPPGKKWASLPLTLTTRGARRAPHTLLPRAPPRRTAST